MVQPLRRQRCFLTGRVRGRPTRFLFRLVMQVEVRIESAGAFELLSYPMRSGFDGDIGAWDEKEKQRIAKAWQYYGTEWRDATWEDQLVLAEMRSNP